MGSSDLPARSRARIFAADFGQVVHATSEPCRGFFGSEILMNFSGAVSKIVRIDVKNWTIATEPRRAKGGRRAGYGVALAGSIFASQTNQLASPPTEEYSREAES